MANHSLHRTIDLVPIRDRLGRHWTAYANAVFGIAETIVRESIGTRDSVSRNGTTIDIAFDAKPARDLGAIVSRIEKTLSATFFGDRQIAAALPLGDVDEDEERIVSRSPAASVLQAPSQGVAVGSSVTVAAPTRAGLVQAAHEKTLSRIRVTYRSIWNVATRVIAVYRATPTLVEDNLILRGDAVLTNLGSRELLARLDELTLSHVVLDLEQLARRGLEVAIVVPLHFASFADEWSSKALLRLCNKIPESARGKVVFESLDAAHGWGDPKFRGVMRLLKPFCNRFGAVMPLRSRDLSFLRELGFATASIEASEQFGTETDIINCLEQFRMSAHRDGLLTAVWGLKTRSLVLSAATMGFDFVHGDMIGSSALEAPMDRIDYDFENLYAD